MLYSNGSCNFRDWPFMYIYSMIFIFFQCGMVLSDFGADVIRIDRAGGGALNYDVTARGKRSIALNVKHDKVGFQLLLD